MPERDEVIMILNYHEKVTAFLKSLAAEHKADTATENYRRRPLGPLNERGEAEIERRFEAGISDSEIALGMNISLSGVAKRRGLWRRGKKQLEGRAQ
jgi:DNA-binding NarL/FixJ family response regulator